MGDGDPGTSGAPGYKEDYEPSDIRLEDDGVIEVIGLGGIYLQGPILIRPPPIVAPTAVGDIALGGLSDELSGSTGVGSDETLFTDLRKIDLGGGYLILGNYLELLRRAILDIEARLKVHGL